MKIFFTFLMLAGMAAGVQAQYCGTSGTFQCTASGSVPGFGDGSNIPPLINGQASTTTIQFRNLDTVVFGAQVLTIQALRFDSIGNLPAGLCWATNSPNNSFSNQQAGCIRLNGVTCAPPGQYKLRIILTINVGVSIQTTADAAGLRLYLRVNNAGETAVAVDTTQSETNPFIAYGSTANCSLTPGVSLGSAQTVCSNSLVTLNPVVSNAQPPYTYQWSATGNALSCNGCEHPSATITQNSAYSVTVIDALNASYTATVNYTVGGAANNMQVNFNSTVITCTSPADTTTATVTGGTGPFTYSWGDGNTSNGSAVATHNYLQGGDFAVAVTDAAGCITSGIANVIYQGIALTSTSLVHPVCLNNADGEITVQASGGTAPYTYHWNNGDNTNMLMNVYPQVYAVTVTDALQCTASYIYNLYPLNGWSYYAYLQPSASNCNNNGAMQNIVSGGTPPYTFAWSNGAISQNLNQLAGGAYSVTVTDAAGCQATATSTVPSACYSFITGRIFNDANNNCQQDNGETAVTNINIAANNGTANYYGNTDNNGYFTIQVPVAGTYNLAVANYYYNNCGTFNLCGGQAITIATLGDSSVNHNLGYTGAASYNLGVWPGWSSANPGFQKDYWIRYYNQSATALNGSATITFTYDSNLIFQPASAPDATHNLVNHTLQWTIDGDSIAGLTAKYCSFMVPLNLSLSQLLEADFRISPGSNDCDSTDNHLHVTEPVTGSHDPNEKEVQPAGRILEEDSMLVYTIHFQNNGTDSTHFIIVTDTLPPTVDPGTVRNLASSHPYSAFDIKGPGILIWTFNPLRLVDSLTNPEGSKGFVKFSVKKKANLPVSSIISNTAFIYFDYNEPVQTNTVADTIAVPNGMAQLANDGSIAINAFPNPFTNATNIIVKGIEGKFSFELYDLNGRLRSRIPGLETTQFQLQRNGLAAGVYFYRVITVNGKGAYGKLVIE